MSVFGYEDKTPYHIYTSKQTFEMHVDLLLLLNFIMLLCYFLLCYYFILY